MSYAPNADGHFDPEYAEVYGVPFSFIPCSGSSPEPKIGKVPTRVRALPERESLAITFPRLAGYRWEIPGEQLDARFTEASRMVLSTQDVATWTENAPIVGESSRHTLDDLKAERLQTVEFRIASLLLDKFYRDDAGNRKIWLFPQLLHITRMWLAECVVLKDDTFPQMLLINQLALEATERIYNAIVASATGQKSLRPIPQPYDPVGSTRLVDFDTTRDTWRTSPEKCHVSHVVADTESWEQKAAQSLEEMPEVCCYVKNHNVGFKIPYTIDGERHDYIPDFLAHLNDGHPDPLQLILEITGQRKKEKGIKVDTAQTFWIPAVKNHGAWGRWAFLEVTDPWDLKNRIYALLKARTEPTEKTARWPG